MSSWYKNKWLWMFTKCIDKFDDKTGICITFCSDSKAGYLFYYELEKKCLKKCNITDYIYKNDDNSINV